MKTHDSSRTSTKAQDLEARNPRRPGIPYPLIDCDVHNKIPASRLASLLPSRWRRHLEDYGFNLSSLAGYTRPRSEGAMTNSWPPTNGVPGSDRNFMVDQLLDPWHHTYAVLNPIDQIYFAGQYGEFAAALDSAINNWTLDEWVAADSRFYASIAVPFETPDLAVAEINRLADNPRCIQVLFNLGTRDPLGNRKYWPIYEAAAAHDLPIGIHVGGTSGWPRSSAGWVSSYFEDHSDFALIFLDQVISLVSEGVFVRFPKLKVVLLEGGFAWMPSLMWRLDRTYGLLHEDLPKLDLLPSEYCRRHFWFTTQPIEEPERPDDFMRVIRQLDMDDRFLFSTDYPHWNFDAPDMAIPASVPAELRERIFSGNALALYRRLPAPPKDVA